MGMMIPVIPYYHILHHNPCTAKKIQKRNLQNLRGCFINIGRTVGKDRCLPKKR
jgi:hypothetical protein